MNQILFVKLNNRITRCEEYVNVAQIITMGPDERVDKPGSWIRFANGKGERYLESMAEIITTITTVAQLSATNKGNKTDGENRG